MPTTMLSHMRSAILLAALCLFASATSASVPDRDLGIEAVKVGDKWAFKDVKTNKIIINPQFDGVASTKKPFFEGLAAVQLNGKWGYIDKTGIWFIEPRFDFADCFKEGLAVINVGGQLRPSVNLTYSFHVRGGIWGFIDRSGEIAIEAKFDGANGFSEGLAAVKISDKWGFIDRKGKITIQPQFEEVRQFDEGFSGVKRDDKWGFIDKTGRVVLKVQFDDVDDFSEGLSAVQVGNKWGFIDKTGQIVIDPKFDEPAVFIYGKADISVSGRGYAIDRTGESFGDWVYVGGSGDTFFYYDPKTVSRSKDIVRAWIKTMANKGVEVKKSLWEINCSERNIRILSTVTYGVGGKVINAYSQPRDWEPIVPESAADVSREALCEKKEDPKSEPKPARKQKGK